MRRQADAFHGAGWEVVAIGLPGGRSPQPDWPILTRKNLPSSEVADSSFSKPGAATPDTGAVPPPRARSMRRWLVVRFREANRFVPVSEQNWSRLEEFLRRGAGRLVRVAWRFSRLPFEFAARLSPAMAQRLYWTMSRDIADIYACGREVNAGVWLANDWTMLPIAARLAREKGGWYGYDTHEFATEEYAERRLWRLWQRPFVYAIERQFIGGASVVSAVSAGIAEHLDTLYRLPRASLVIRNMPAFEEIPFRPTRADRIRVLYHGIVAPNRGLEAAIDSVAEWRLEFDLTMRGPGDAEYLNALRRRIVQQGLDDRVQLVPPVPMTALVREAAQFDIGFFALPGHSRHNQFALPNKFFEYVMAGLALCTTDLPEMARLLRQYELGVTLPAVEPGAIASTINALEPGRIDRCKRCALAAARELCWDRESKRLVDAYSAMPNHAISQG